MSVNLDAAQAMCMDALDRIAQAKLNVIAQARTRTSVTAEAWATLHAAQMSYLAADAIYVCAKLAHPKSERLARVVAFPE